MRALSLALLLAAGCGSGCDGERGKPPEAPRPPITAPGDAGVPTLENPDGGVVAEVQTGYLDAPARTMDHLYKALAAAENKEPTARVLMVFFGDSHTAGDSMTSRIRTTWQPK